MAEFLFNIWHSVFFPRYNKVISLIYIRKKVKNNSARKMALTHVCTYNTLVPRKMYYTHSRSCKKKHNDKERIERERNRRIKHRYMGSYVYTYIKCTYKSFYTTEKPKSHHQQRQPRRRYTHLPYISAYLIQR